jgi:iron complex transport system substrate-binding protein
LFGRAKGSDLEALVAVRPDIIIDIGSIDQTHVSAADRVQAQTGIAYVILYGSFEKTAGLYEALGGLLDEKAKTEELAE